ncbi:MAG: Rpn family recombination-promoting nuclease/putative transposase [Bdellovibrionota bacterium]
MTEKRKINIGKNNGKMGRPAPEWLRELEDGIYSIAELEIISSRDSSNIMHQMKRYAKDVSYVVQENARSSARYHWDQEHFLTLINQKIPKIKIEEVVVTDVLMDPKVDIIFKELFGRDETNFINLANAILDLKEDQKIISVEFLDKEMPKAKKGDRGAILDVLAKLNNGAYINLEMQYGDHKDFEQRSTFYFSKIFASQLKKNQLFHELKPVIMVNILNFELYKDADHFHTPVICVDGNHREIRRNPHFEMHFFEVPKFKKTCYDETSPQEKWMLFFKEPKEETLKELAMQDAGIARAFGDLQDLSKNSQKRAEYEARKMALLTHQNDIYASRKEGKEEGKLEASLTVVRRMKADGVPLLTIMKYSGLTKEQIEQA